MRLLSLSVVSVAAGLTLGNTALAQQIADTIYTGGPILTIDDAQPTVQAVRRLYKTI